MWAVGTRVPRLRLLLVTYVGVTLAWLPMLRFAMTHRDRIAWIPPLTPVTAADNLVALGGGLLVGTFLLVLVVLGLRRDVITLWLIVPIAGTILISLVVQPTLQGKYLIGVLPAAAIVAARARPAAIAAVVLVSLVAVGSWYVNGVKDDWRTGVAWVRAQAQPTDGVIFSPSYARQPFEYYGEVGRPLYPSIPWDGTYLSSMGLDIDPPADAGTSRVWLIEAFGPPAPQEVQALIAGYQQQASGRFGELGPWIRLMVER
jgi:hypothetical protein